MELLKPVEHKGITDIGDALKEYIISAASLEEADNQRKIALDELMQCKASVRILAEELFGCDPTPQPKVLQFPWLQGKVALLSWHIEEPITIEFLDIANL